LSRREMPSSVKEALNFMVCSPSVAAAADSGFVSSAGGERLSGGGGCAERPCLRLFWVLALFGELLYSAFCGAG
jgi:hypothetical protein